jgi:hypothetical protein
MPEPLQRHCVIAGCAFILPSVKLNKTPKSFYITPPPMSGLYDDLFGGLSEPAGQDGTPEIATGGS